MVRHKDIARNEDYREALKHHSPFVKDGERGGKLTNLF